MSFLRPLKNELFRYRKHKSIAPEGSRRMPYESSYKTPSPAGEYQRPQLYHQDLPREYRPSLFSPNVHWSEYTPEPFELPPAAPEPRLFRPLPEPALSDRLDSHKPMERMFPEMSSESYQREVPDIPAVSGPALKPTDHKEQVSRFFDITDALGILQQSLPSDHPDVRNLRQAFSEMIRQPDLFPDTGPMPVSRLGEGDPYRHDDIFPAKPDYLEMHTALPEMSLEPAVDGFSQPLPESPAVHEFGLEQIVEREFAALESAMPDVMGMDPAHYSLESAFEEINQAIDQARQMPDPFTMDPMPMPGYGMGPM